MFGQGWMTVTTIKGNYYQCYHSFDVDFVPIFEGEVLVGGPAPDFTNIDKLTSLLKTLIESTDDILRFVADVDATSVIDSQQ